MSNVPKRKLLRRRKVLLKKLQKHRRWSRVEALMWWEKPNLIFGGISAQEMWIMRQYDNVEKLIEKWIREL